jgi:aminoglycoside phosphotransferase (APT) family kinase protein
MPDSGMVNEAWLIGDSHVLRIIANEDADDEAEREGLVVPLVRAAGVRSPELTVCKTGRANGTPPYTIYERADGELLGHLHNDPMSFEGLYCELGREIYLLNQIEVESPLVGKLRKGSTFDAAKQLALAMDKELVGAADAVSVERMIGWLSDRTGEKADSRFLHQDIHPWNLFVDPDTLELTAVIDWGDAAFGDPAAEFASMPLFAVGPMLRGYTEAGGHVDSGFVARSLLLGIALALWEMRELDAARFNRQWWRFSPKGWSETLAWIEKTLTAYD